jgi:hypothetical protein
MSTVTPRVPSSRPRLWSLLLAVAALTCSGLVAAEPPSRAARLGYISGTVGFSPAGSDEWVRAVVNRPLTNGDRLWVDANSRAELQVGGAAIRLGASTSVTLLNLDDRIAQLQLSQGTLKVRVRRMGQNQAFEVDTPNLAFYMRRPGEYRIDVDPNDDATAVRVLSGRAEVYGDRASYSVNPKQGFRFYGTDLSDYDRLATRRDDELDRWARERDRRDDNSRSANYVSRDVVGYEDLDTYGTWRSDPQYGNVWAPSQVSSGWTPYRDGHWAWIDPWGWTWVDDAPWGYAVSHYGRWANTRGSWVWVPGPRQQQAVYAPALVGFVGGQNSQGLSAVAGVVAALVGWFPLAPREVYQPSYPVSRGYFDRINRSNAAIAPATITNVYNTTIVNQTTNVTRVVYANQRVQGAVVAVPAQAFANSQPVGKAAVQVSKESAASAPVAPVAAVAPVKQSVHGGGRESGARPPAREHRIVARTAPPPAPITFAAQQKELAATPGKPIDDARRKELKPAAAALPAVSVIAAPQAAAPAAAPPATPPAAKSPEARKEDAASRRDARRADAAKADTARGDADKADRAKGDAARGDAAKRDAAKADAAKADAAKADATKADAKKAEAAKDNAARRDAAKLEAAKADAAKAEAARADAAKADAAKADTAKAAAKADATKADAKKAEAAKDNAARREAAMVEAAKADAAKAEAARADAAKAEAAKVATEKAEAAKAAAAKADAAKAEAVRAEAAKADAARAAAVKAEAARADAAKAEAGRVEAAKAGAAKADAAKADAAKAAAKAEASRAEAAKAEAARAEAAKAAAVKADAAKAEAARAESAKAESAKAEAAKIAIARAEAIKAEAVKGEAAKREAGKTSAEKADAKAARAIARAARSDAQKAEDEKKKAEEDGQKR